MLRKGQVYGQGLTNTQTDTKTETYKQRRAMHTDIIEERRDGQRYKGNTYTHRERARQINSRGRGRQGERGTDIGGRRGQ